MMKMFKPSIGATLITLLLASPILFAKGQEEKVKEDLFAVIALHGRPCGRVTDFHKRGDDDYIAICQDGNRYRVHVVAGRVQVDKQ